MEINQRGVRNTNIDIMRVICALLVIVGHTHPMYQVNSKIDFILTNILARVAVPFFFITAGYFLYKESIKNKEYYKTYAKNIAITYIRWQVLYVVFNLIIYRKYISIKYLLKTLKNYIFGGVEDYLWFFPALIISIIIVGYIIKKGRYKLLALLGSILFLIGILGGSYNQLIRGSSVEYIIRGYELIFDCTRNGPAFGVPFIAMGVWISRLNINNRYNIKYLPIFFITLMVMSIEIIFLRKILNNNIYDIYISQTLFAPIVFLWILDLKMKFRVDGKKLRDLSLCLYLSHGVIILILRLLAINNILTLRPIKKLFVVLVCSLCISYIITKIKANNREEQRVNKYQR